MANFQKKTWVSRFTLDKVGSIVGEYVFLKIQKTRLITFLRLTFKRKCNPDFKIMTAQKQLHFCTYHILLKLLIKIYMALVSA